jgi:hypothetical protein
MPKPQDRSGVQRYHRHCRENLNRRMGSRRHYYQKRAYRIGDAILSEEAKEIAQKLRGSRITA